MGRAPHASGRVLVRSGVSPSHPGLAPGQSCHRVRSDSTAQGRPDRKNILKRVPGHSFETFEDAIWRSRAPLLSLRSPPPHVTAHRRRQLPSAQGGMKRPCNTNLSTTSRAVWNISRDWSRNGIKPCNPENQIYGIIPKDSIDLNPHPETLRDYRFKPTIMP